MKYLRLSLIMALLSLGGPLVFYGEPPNPCMKKSADPTQTPQINQPQSSAFSTAITVALRMLIP